MKQQQQVGNIPHIYEQIPILVNNYALATWRLTVLMLLMYISVSTVTSIKSDF